MGLQPMRWIDHAITANPRTDSTSFTRRISSRRYNIRARGQAVASCGIMEERRVMLRRTLSNQTAVLLGVASLLLTAYLVLAVDAAHHQLLPGDRGVRAWVQPMRSGTLDLPMAAVSFRVEPAGLVPLILLTSAGLWRASRRWAVLLPLIMAGTGALQVAGKWGAARARAKEAPGGVCRG